MRFDAFTPFFTPYFSYMLGFIFCSCVSPDSGETYDEILFLCLKYRLSDFFKTRLTPVRRNSGQLNILIGELLVEKIIRSNTTLETNPVRRANNLVMTYYEYNGKAGVILYTGYTNSTLTRLIQSQSVDAIYFTGLRTGNDSFWNGGRTLNLKDLSSEVITFLNEGVDKILESAELKDYKEKIIDQFCNELEEEIEYFMRNTDYESDVLYYDWEPFLIKLPEVALFLPRGSNNNADFEEDSVRLLAGKVLGICLKYVQSDETKETLINFGNNNSLEFNLPNERKSKTLF